MPHGAMADILLYRLLRKLFYLELLFFGEGGGGHVYFVARVSKPIAGDNASRVGSKNTYMEI